jgi:hypothetical protein
MLCTVMKAEAWRRMIKGKQVVEGRRGVLEQ